MSVSGPRPVLVGVAQFARHPDAGTDLTRLPEPVQMMTEVARGALADSGRSQRLIGKVSSVRVVAPLSWSYVNPAAIVADELRLGECEKVLSTTGGNSPQMLVNDACRAVARGEHDVVIVVGAEANYTRRLARLNGTWLAWIPRDTPAPAPLSMGSDKPGVHPSEAARSLVLPVNIYPLFENALRFEAGEGIEEHQVRISELWSEMSAVASRNPHAWSRRKLTPEEIRTPSESNRMVSFPYPVLMTANIQTDQAAALVIASEEAARSAGVPRDRWVFPLCGSVASDHWYVSERYDLHSSPAIRLAGRTALGLAGRGIDDIAHVDLYSCFPSAVQIGAAELGLDPLERPLTVTGGLSFAGGPGNNYVTHSIASMVEVLRQHPGSLGMVTALGWYLTKHAVGLYSTDPPGGGYRWESPQAEVDALPSRQVVEDHDGDVTVESYTVSYERDGTAAVGWFACMLPDGRRAWGRAADPVSLAEVTSREACGMRGRLRLDGDLELL